MKTYDAIVIGAGSGGLTSAVGFKNIGKSVLLVEKEHMGGECTNTGCIPSKAILNHAKKYHLAKKLAGDSPSLSSYKNETFNEIKRIVDGILAHETPDVFKEMGIDVIMGEATFTGKNTVSVNDKNFEFKKAVIATGSSPRMIDIKGLDEKYVLTNQNVFTQEKIPEKLLVIGSGPIGMELGQAFAMLGSEVTIGTIDHRFAKLEDPEISPIIRKEFEELGVTIYDHAFISHVDGDTAHFNIKDDEGHVLGSKSIEFEKVLIAIGRVPNIPTGLENAGIKYNKHAIETNIHYRTTNKNVYAVGDVSLRNKFTHTADDAARHVVKEILLPFTRPQRFRQVPKVTYTQPEIAAVGLSHAQAADKYGKDSIIKISVPFSENDRAITDGSTENGLAIITAKKLSGRILGANIIGQSAGEILSTITLAMEQKISLWKINSLVFPYPTISQVIKKASDKFLAYQLGNIKGDVLSLIKRNGSKLFALVFWGALISTFFWYKNSNNLTFLDMARSIGDINATVWGPLIFIVIYTLRPLIFFTATLLTILAGVLFGLWGGIAWTMIGENLSANVAYWVGRFFGGDIKLPEGVVKHFRDEARKNSFMTVLVARFIYLPFDLTNYAAGIMKIKWSSYALATIIGIIPGMTTFVALGASFQSIADFDPEMVSANPKTLALSAVLFIGSLILARFIKKQQSSKKTL